MDEGLPSVSIFLFFIILLTDIFVHGFCVAIGHVKEDDIEKDNQEKKSIIGSGLLRLLENPKRHMFDEAIQLVCMVINMVLGAVVVSGIARYLERFCSVGDNLCMRFIVWLLTCFVIVFVIMCFGIAIPARLAGRKARQWAYVCYYPVKFLQILFYPIVLLIHGFSGAVLYLFGVRGDDNLDDVTEEEIKSMVSEGQEQGVLQETEADMITNIFEFSDKEAQDIMTNRNAMVAIDANLTLKQAVNFMMDTNNSRFPVYLDDIDHIIGIMHIRDAMKKLSEETDNDLPIRKIKGLLRQPKFVPETRNIDSLFHNMQSSKTQMVIVIDEYGQTAGLVSMEDILEEIVGNILDEYDEDEDYIKPTKNQGEFIVDGMTPLEVLEKKFELSFDDTEFETLNGFLISKLDRIPEEDVDFSVDEQGYSFTILSVENHKILSVLMKKLPKEELTEQDDEVEIAK
ncbi:hemolysin family protein [Butyrivibrio sp. INlla21]|uniref:hemolysin family protein n=1 Tax=Butyrivibrio sp. INlla21 TaxID=1520811 RepID=UPI0008E6013A|nr:hemolysin family protein [Butyrivibrio sp. INlla21]SFU98143.1 putative hemolysin [Butyrivibrio sp. INlla21]